MAFQPGLCRLTHQPVNLLGGIVEIEQQLLRAAQVGEDIEITAQIGKADG